MSQDNELETKRGEQDQSPQNEATPSEMNEEPEGYPKPPEQLTKMAVGTQLHHAKICRDLKDMVKIAEAKIEAEMQQKNPSAEEIAKLEKIRDAAKTELDKRRYEGLTV